MEIEQKKYQKEIDQRIEKSINDIFKTYDRDSSGFLDKSEAK
jgi:Ca2+-binding EF-hand superfamily protein